MNVNVVHHHHLLSAGRMSSHAQHDPVHPLLLELSASNLALAALYSFWATMINRLL
jgi:hypothetical protein